ncbi:DUF411 domain-containing protein [Gammaproteobacteria bacterium AB-CW1]|uniref:DUF411 domain-containing protein n=1 Tax=Natronospira elongata TaxID=3110268 RepID=A0AAP6MLY6_9GAMM|nr:DUF411 domain-containing protein [Gammaproteobacteria bacterium AB-CW1]
MKTPRSLLSLLLILSLAACGQEPAAESNEMLVYKTPQCGCCSVWVDYIEEAGFEVEARDVSHQELNEIKREAGLPFSLGSCHTAFVDGYVVEGHVPAEQVHRLLEERPDILGIAVAGMPIGSPGMEMGDRKDPYEVLTFNDEGESEVFARYHQEE